MVVGGGGWRGVPGGERAGTAPTHSCCLVLRPTGALHILTVPNRLPLLLTLCDCCRRLPSASWAKIWRRRTMQCSMPRTPPTSQLSVPAPARSKAVASASRRVLPWSSSHAPIAIRHQRLAATSCNESGATVAAAARCRHRCAAAAAARVRAQRCWSALALMPLSV